MKKKFTAAIIVILMMGTMTACIHVHKDPQTGEIRVNDTVVSEDQSAEAPAAEGNSSETAAPGTGTMPGDEKNEQPPQAEISEEKAREIALADAGVKAKDAVLKFTELDYDDGFMVYEVEFFANDKEYSYDIDAASGNILSKEVEMMDAEDYMEREALT